MARRGDVCACINPPTGTIEAHGDENVPEMKQKPKIRAMLFTAGILLAVTVLLPAVMGVVGQWNAAVADMDGRMWTLQDNTDVRKQDPVSDENDGEAILVETNESTVVNVTEQTVTWGNASNLGYHTIDPIVCDDNTTENKFIFMAFNLTSKQLRDNDTYSFVTELRGLEEGALLISGFWLVNPSINKTDMWWDGGRALNSMQQDEYCLISENSSGKVEDASTTGEFTVLYYNFTLWDVLEAEDYVVSKDNYIVYALQVRANDTLNGAFMDFRIYALSPRGTGYITQQVALDMTYGSIGLICLVFGLFATPWINLQPKVGVRQHMRAARDGFRKKRFNRRFNSNGGGYRRNSYRGRR